LLNSTFENFPTNETKLAIGFLEEIKSPDINGPNDDDNNPRDGSPNCQPNASHRRQWQWLVIARCLLIAALMAVVGSARLRAA
jgi:hypothetical protein